MVIRLWDFEANRSQKVLLEALTLDTGLVPPRNCFVFPLFERNPKGFQVPRIYPGLPPSIANSTSANFQATIAVEFIYLTVRKYTIGNRR